MHLYIGTHLHPDSPSSYQNQCVFRFSSDANRWALQVLIQLFLQSTASISNSWNNSGSLFPIDDTSSRKGNKIKHTVVHCRQLITAIITPTCQYKDCCCVQLITEINSTSVTSVHTLKSKKHLKHLPVYLYWLKSWQQ